MSWEGQGFPWAGRAVPRDFPWALPLGNPSEQCCHTLDNLVLSSPYLYLPNHLLTKDPVDKMLVDLVSSPDLV